MQMLWRGVLLLFCLASFHWKLPMNHICLACVTILLVRLSRCMPAESAKRLRGHLSFAFRSGWRVFSSGSNHNFYSLHPLRFSLADKATDTDTPHFLRHGLFNTIALKISYSGCSNIQHNIHILFNFIEKHSTPHITHSNSIAIWRTLLVLARSPSAYDGSGTAWATTSRRRINLSSWLNSEESGGMSLLCFRSSFSSLSWLKTFRTSTRWR